MNRVGQVRTAAVRRVVHRIIAEGNVSNRRIEIVLRKRRVLEAPVMNG